MNIKIGENSTKLHYLKKIFHSHLNINDITDTDYTQAKTFCEDFKIKYLGEYHHLYIQNDTLLLADVFEKFWNMCLKIYELDPARFLTAQWLLWQAALKKTKVKFDLFIKKIKVTLFINMKKVITNTWKIMIEIKNGHIWNIRM